MSRPKPDILLEYTNPKNYKSEQVLKAEAIYAVFYKDAPVNLRSLNTLVNYPGPKYKKVSLIVIPARGGSKGIARKNIRPLAGFPLIYYSIQASKNINFIARRIKRFQSQ